MKLARPTKRQWILVSVVLPLYCFGYVWARANHVLVHRAAFSTDGNARTYYHQVTTGDFGPGLLQSPATRWITSTSYWLFTPLRLFEALGWHFMPERLNSPP
jgi:hypothetical protein